jgi:diacylglycerol kinase (ATP)
VQEERRKTGKINMSKKNKLIRAKLIANPGAKLIKEQPSRIEEVHGYLMDCGLQVDVAIAHPKREAIAIAQKAVKRGYDVVIAMGGDGTIDAVISGIGGSKMRLGIIPAGTSNDIAKSLGIPFDLKEASALIAGGRARKLDLGQISTRKIKKSYFFMLTAIGLTATIYPMVSEVPEGKLTGIKEAVSTFLNFDTKPTVFLTLDDESKIKIETMLVTVANTPLIGAKNLVAPNALMDDGLLDIAVYPNYTKADLLAYFARTANEGQIADGTIQRYQARKIKVKTSPKLDIAAEGIILGRGSARIKVLPGALRVICPNPADGVKKKDEIPDELPKEVQNEYPFESSR